MSILIADAILIADLALKVGDKVITKLQESDNETITREELREMLALPDFESFSTKKQKEKGET
jgi:hypothetical protein